MNRVNILLDIEQEDLMDNNQENEGRKIKIKNKTINIDDGLFDIALRKGLIRKTEDGYLFVGDYTELLALKKDPIPK